MPDEPSEGGGDTPGTDTPAWVDLRLTLAGGIVVAATLFLTVLSVGLARSAKTRVGELEVQRGPTTSASVRSRSRT